MEVGRLDLFWLTVDQVIAINRSVTGGRGVLRSPQLVDSALHAPLQTFEGRDLHPSFLHKIAALLRSFAENQPFTDGNKRTAWTVADVTLRGNGFHLKATVGEVVDTMLGVARKSVGTEDLVDFLLAHVSE